MDGVYVTTIAGSGEDDWRDGIGTAAAFHGLEGICYSQANDALLLADVYTHRIRCLRPAPESRKVRFVEAMSHVLIESGALPILALISIISEYVLNRSTTTHLPHLTLPYRLCSGRSIAICCVVI